MPSSGQTRLFDLTPHPRILPMLGEIVLPQWRCLAELIDNSVDSFLEAARKQEPVPHPLIAINLPTGAHANAMVSVRDNGPGMDMDTLERAARAGWTSHDPINNLGLFGMGFNIATARLGQNTTIWTTRRGDREWVGLEIDFEHLGRQQGFITPALTRVKRDPDQSGTEVTIGKMKPEQREWLSKGHNRSTIGKHLGRTYSTMLGAAKKPIAFQLEINGVKVSARVHCVWGGPESPPRSVETTRHGTVDAFQPFDLQLPSRPFCIQCWNWLAAGQTVCPACGDDGRIVERKRRVHGWLGIQRFLDPGDFGIDLLRNGRKIEVANKDLFSWRNENSDADELEYPIDDPRNRGRIVGEVHLDHCRVPYTKERFVREDAAWAEMVELVRGRGPLRPDIADRLGIGGNSSPLFRLFQAFRRSSPHNKRAGGWSKILVVPDNEVARTMARRFEAGEGPFQTDAKWWDLVEQADIDALTTPSPTSGSSPVPPPPVPTFAPGPGPGSTQPPPPAVRRPIANLSQTYIDDVTGHRYDVLAFAVEETDHALGSHELFDPARTSATASPWAIRRTAAGPWEFYVNTRHSVFQSATMTPLDALLTQIAWVASDFVRGQGGQPFATILAGLRARYAKASQLDAGILSAEATAQLIDIARSVVGRVDPQDLLDFFNQIGPSHQEAIRVAMASKGVSNPQAAENDGRFLEFSSPRTISEFVRTYPELFFDGNYWDDAYASLNFGSAAATEEAQKRVSSHYYSLLADAVWLAQQGVPGQGTSRERLLRAALATLLLARSAGSTP